MPHSGRLASETANPLAGLEPGQQRARHVLGGGEQFRVGPPPPGGRVSLPIHQGGPVRHLRRDPPEQAAHRGVVPRDTMATAGQ